MKQPGDLCRSRGLRNLQDLDLGAAAFPLKLGEISSLSGVTVPAGEPIISFALYRGPTSHERPSTVLNVD
jgi:hypothetical protein